jgi:hypothetical protein
LMTHSAGATGCVSMSNDRKWARMLAASQSDPVSMWMGDRRVPGWRPNPVSIDPLEAREALALTTIYAGLR